MTGPVARIDQLATLLNVPPDGVVEAVRKLHWERINVRKLLNLTDDADLFTEASKLKLKAREVDIDWGRTLLQFEGYNVIHELVSDPENDLAFAKARLWLKQGTASKAYEEWCKQKKRIAELEVLAARDETSKSAELRSITMTHEQADTSRAEREGKALKRGGKG